MKSTRHGLIVVVSLLVLAGLGTTNGAQRRSTGLPPACLAPELVPANPDGDQTYPVRVTWAGVGQLRSFTVTNVALLGLYEPSISWPGYDGSWPEDVTNWNGYCCEWPAGSRQYYNFSTGIWVGGKIPDPVGGARRPIVATGAYDPDFTPVSPLWASDQFITPAEQGEPLFVQPGEEKAPGQKRWGDPADFSGYRYYAHTDTAAINARRRGFFGSGEYDIKATDFVSQMDTYCAMGDHVPEDEGYFLYPSDGYDLEPLGVRLEQRTYSWSYGPGANYVYIDYKITNMNSFPIDSLYIGYFMDNDVGAGDLDIMGVGPNDDLIGFDRNLNLGYTYDSDFNEPGWATSAGYIGVVFCETPTNPDETQPLGLTAFSTWTREGAEGDVDQDNQDGLKFAQLRGTGIADDPDPRIFETFEEPQDVRHLSSSGPYLQLLPGETVSVTLAVVMGSSLDELKENTIRAVQQFEMGYLGTAPPPSPAFVVTPQDRKVFLSWDDSPEDVVDLITGEQDFEGYRVYRSRTGVEGAWELLADYDVQGSKTAKSVKVSYKRGGSQLQFGSAGFWGAGEDTISFVGNNYALEFQTDTTFTVFNTDQQSLYCYSIDARDVFTGDFCVVDAEDDGAVYPQANPYNEFLGQWVSGARIYIDGFYVVISEGEPDPDAPQGTVYSPVAGDLFFIETFNWNEIGEQTGLHYSFLDEHLINGLTYYYAVTSYDKGSPVQGIEPLESSVAQVRVRVVPRSRAADKQDPDANLTRVKPATGTGESYLDMVQPVLLTGHQYRIECLSRNGEEQAWWWIMRDMDLGEVISDTTAILRWDYDDTSQTRAIQYPDDLADQITLEGMLVALKAPKGVAVDEVAWNSGSLCSWVPQSFDWNQYEDRLEPYDYAMTFPAEGGLDVEGNPVPWHMINLTLDESAKTYLRHGTGGDPDAWDSRDHVFILPQSAETFSMAELLIRFNMVMDDTTSPAGSSDTLYIRTMRPFYPGDAYVVETAHMLADKSSYGVDEVKVVPNPYYLRAQWDTNQYNRWVNFQHLPSRCTIRIFTVSGLLIRELEQTTESDDGSARWDLLTEEGMHCASGLYVFQVEDSATGKTAIGKFAIVR